MKGTIEVITGCMCCGKTEELIRRLWRAKIAKQPVAVFKPLIDVREDCLKSRNGQTMEAEEVQCIQEIIKRSRDFSIIGIDEAQFFPDLMKINILVDQGKRVIVSALDTDFRGEPFGDVPDLIAISDEHLLLKAICVQCGALALRSQRLIDGKPAPYGSPLIAIGDRDMYEPRCRNCHAVPGRP